MRIRRGSRTATSPSSSNPKKTTTNYEQISAIALNRYQGAAKPAQDRASSAKRDFETSETALQQEVVAQESQCDSQLVALCGSKALSDCYLQTPVPGSEMASAQSEVEVANERVLEAENSRANLSAEVQIEIDRVKSVNGVRDLQAKLLLSDGKTLVDLNWADAGLDLVTGTINNIAETIQSAAAATGLGNWGWGGVGAVVAGSLREQALEMSTMGKATIEAQRLNVTTLQQARVQWSQNDIESANSDAVIKTKLLESANLGIECTIAAEALGQALDHVDGVFTRAKYYDSERTRFQTLQQQQLRNLLYYRVYADQLDLAAQDALTDLRQWAYLATRAAEYELNVSYPSTGDLWKSRTADDVNAFLFALDGYFVRNRQLAPQTNLDVLSVRDDILDMSASVKDRVTGATVDARERFHRFVADPANRDINGNLHINFSTVRPDKSFFSKAVCNDRIQSIRINLVGDNLGTGVTTAYVLLSQGGVNYLRSCSDATQSVAYDLSDQNSKARTARIEAGVNAASRIAAGQANTDLILRAVLADSWEITIDQRPEMEPGNANLNVMGLDDIEVIVEHEASTVQ